MVSRFQSYQSKQINPDKKKIGPKLTGIRCFNRINPNRSIPTCIQTGVGMTYQDSFNRINPNRSIPTLQKNANKKLKVEEFQSYQSKQINPDPFVGQ